MSRRFHKKSKNGCISCKQRHIKCDEVQPTCVNCQTSSFVCTYPTSIRSQRQKPSSSSGNSQADLSSTRTQNSEQAGVQIIGQCPVNLDHLELLCHFCYETWKEFSSDWQGDQIMFNETIRELRESIHTSPYLMYQALATAALHLSVIRPAHKDHYHSLATDLQMQAVSSFRNAVLDLDNSNCVPAFRFSSFLGVTLLGDSLQHHQDNFEDFLQHFTQHLHIHRGARAITNQFWAVISQTKLVSHIMKNNQPHNNNDKNDAECAPLRDLINSTTSDLGSFSVYQNAIEHLQNTFNMCRSLSARANSVHAVFAWPVLVSADYAHLLEQQKPEALTILAYYAVLIHRHRHIWVFGKGGQFLIESIRNKLPLENEKWLEWPIAELNTSHS